MSRVKPQSIDVALVLELYTNGNSTRKVAKMLNTSHGYIGRIIKAAGISRDRTEAVRMVCKPTNTKHWRSCRQQARKLMQRVLGRVLGRLEHVHHINGDYTDNRLENLAVLNASDHMRHHHKKYDEPRGQRASRKAYQKSYFSKIKNIEEACAFCGKPFMKNKYSTAITCGNPCGQRLRRLRRESNQA